MDYKATYSGFLVTWHGKSNVLIEILCVDFTHWDKGHVHEKGQNFKGH